MDLGNANFGFSSATNHDLKIDKLLKLATLKKNEIGEAKVVTNGMNITKIDLVTVSDAILTGVGKHVLKYSVCIEIRCQVIFIKLRF